VVRCPSAEAAAPQSIVPTSNNALVWRSGDRSSKKSIIEKENVGFVQHTQTSFSVYLYLCSSIPIIPVRFCDITFGTKMIGSIECDVVFNILFFYHIMVNKDSHINTTIIEISC